MNQSERKILIGLKDTIVSKGVVSKSDVMSMEEACPGIVSDSFNVNSFTSLATSTNFNSLVEHLDTIISAESKEEAAINITDYILELKKLRSKLVSVRGLFNVKDGCDLDLISDIKENNYISFYKGKELVNPLTLTPDEFLENVYKFNDALLVGKKQDIAENINRIAYLLSESNDNKPLTIFSLLTNLVNNDMSLFHYENNMEPYLIGDVVDKLIVSGLGFYKIGKLVEQIDAEINYSIFDFRFDLNENHTDYNYTYNHKHGHIVNMLSLFEDSDSLNLFKLLKMYFTK